MHTADPVAIVNRYRVAVDTEIRSLLEGCSDLPLYRMIRYHLGLEDGSASPSPAHAGKRLRAAMCMLSCAAAGADASSAAPAAAALELLHSFTLLHDDIADRDATRRGRETVWSRWGIGQAITAGDALYALSNLAAARLADRGAPSDAVVSILEDLNRATLAVCEGQHLDIAYEGRQDVTAEDYLAMIERKTAALFAAACALGARVAGAPDHVVGALRSFGKHTGIGFQIQDDVLGIWGEEEAMGKPVGSDLRRNKRSLPVVHALRAAGESERQALAERLAAGIDAAEAAHIAARMEELGSRRFCRETARESLDRGLEALRTAGLAPGPADDLAALAGYLIDRTK